MNLKQWVFRTAGTLAIPVLIWVTHNLHENSHENDKADLQWLKQQVGLTLVADLPVRLNTVTRLLTTDPYNVELIKERSRLETEIKLLEKRMQN